MRKGSILAAAAVVLTACTIKLPTAPAKLPAPVAHISIWMPYDTLWVTQQLQPTIVPTDSAGNIISDAPDGHDVWASSNPRVAAVDPTGVVTAISGPADDTITVRAFGLTASKVIRVDAIPVGIR